MPYAALHYATYERFRAAIAPQALRVARPSSHGRPPVWVDLLAGSCSGATAVAVTYPLDLVRTRMAYNMKSHSGATIMSTLRSIVAREGARGLYRVRPLPASVLMCIVDRMFIPSAVTALLARPQVHRGCRSPQSMTLTQAQIGSAHMLPTGNDLM